MTVPTSSEIRAPFHDLDIYRAYMRSQFLSIKHSSYFHVYEELLAKYRGKKFTFVEIGVLNGGSLFMWRDFFGPKVRIVGIDLNPAAKKWENENFEIFVGSQSDENFWDYLFSTVGNVDVVLDDGGHTNEQQIITAEKCIPRINDGGMLIVEDTHASYLRSFGNPSKYSFINYCVKLIDSINSRFPGVNASRKDLNQFVSSIEFFESMVCFRVDRGKCFISSPTSNGGISSNAEDFRDHGSILHKFAEYVRREAPFLEKFGGADIARVFFSIRSRSKSRKLGKYFY